MPITRDTVEANRSGKISLANPSHYARRKIQPLEFIVENDLDFPVGNVVKYVVRYQDKGGVADLYKARAYLDKLIARAEGRGDWIHAGDVQDMQRVRSVRNAKGRDGPVEKGAPVVLPRARSRRVHTPD